MSQRLDITLPLSLPWVWSADIQRQTGLSLARLGHTVRVYLPNEGEFWWDQLRHRWLGKVKDEDAQKNLIFYRPISLFPRTQSERLNHLNDVLAARLFRWWVGVRAKDPKVLWLCGLEFEDYPTFFKGWKSLYYCSDYFSFDVKPTAESLERERKEAALFASTDLAFVNSHILYSLHRKKRKKQPRLGIVSQGYCIQDFQQFEVGRTMKRQGRLLVGYVGGISERMDWPLLERLVNEHPEWDFAFYYPVSNGPQAVGGAEFARIVKKKNVMHGTTRHRRELAGLIKQFDIGMIPYDSRRPFNWFCFPMKIYEYFFFGLPVISTKNAELQRFSRWVKVSDSYDAWVRWIKKIEASGWPLAKQNEEKRQARLRGWDHQVGLMVRALEKVG